MEQIRIKLLRETSIAPRRATDGSAGYDLFADCAQPVEVLPGRSVIIPAGFALELPRGYVALVCARSSMAGKHGVAPTNAVGVIDSDYRGEISACLTCHHEQGYAVQPGERFAQLLILPVETPELAPAESLSETSRGAGGFGSTGKR